MGEARRRGTFEERKAEAIKAGRFPEARRTLQKDARITKANIKAEYLTFLRKLVKDQQEAVKQQIKD